MSKVLSFLKRTAMAVTLSALALLALEGLIRISGLVSEAPLPSPLAFQQLPPHVQQTMSDKNVVNFEGGRRRLALKNPVGKRIFLLGGSAAFGDGYTPHVSFGGVLEKWLNEAYDEPIEVINLGQGGIGSLHVRTVLSNLLKVQKPDLILIYSGNNEFHELRAIKHLNPDFDSRVEWTRRRLSQLQLYRLMREKILGFSNESQYQNDPSVDPPNIAQLAVTVNEDDRKLVELLYKENIQAMFEMAQDAKVPILFGTVSDNLIGGSNFRDLSPDLRNELDKLIRTGQVQKIEIDPFMQSNSSLRSSSEANHKVGHYHLKKNNVQKAWDYLYLAERLDPKPVRSNHVMRDSIREVSSQKGAHLCDIESQIRKQRPNTPPGQDLYNDPCHPNAYGHRLIASIWAHCIFENQFFGPPNDVQVATNIAELGQQKPKDDPWRLDQTLTRRGSPQMYPGVHATKNTALPGEKTAQEAHQAYLQDQYLKAFNLYERAIEEGGPEGPLRWSRALAALHLQDINLVRQEMDRALNLMEADPEMYALRQSLGDQQGTLAQ